MLREIYREKRVLGQGENGSFLAILVIRSGFLPRFLGYWLIINGFAYLIISFAGLLLLRYEEMVSNIAFPALLGEMGFMLWLVIKGTNA